ncbi:hypothetical protein NE553_15820, partial [Eggerthella lenta]|nr:hypothetical protein [Eggerthella lenta]
ISMCTDVLLPTTDRFPFAGNTTLWVLVLTTVGYLVVALARRLSPFLTHRASFLAAGGLTAAGTVTLPIALTLGSGAARCPATATRCRQGTKRTPRLLS